MVRARDRASEKGPSDMWRRVTQCFLVVGVMTMALASSVPASAHPVPEKLRAPGNNVLLFTARAVGAQIYVCKAQAASPNVFAWIFKAPEATLYNERGDKISRHYGGPTWEGN